MQLLFSFIKAYLIKVIENIFPRSYRVYRNSRECMRNLRLRGNTRTSCSSSHALARFSRVSPVGDLAVRAQSMISIANRNPYQYTTGAWRMKNIFLPK